jgi:hypothetical protein
MNTRMRSPNYPSTHLEQAIDFVEKIHKSERTNPVDRSVAAQAMGYSGISGRSAKVLADLSQYGLLEKAGKNEVRVSKRAVDILHPDSAEVRLQALRDAAFQPELFQRIREKFPAGQPSEAALHSYFVREDFTDAAIQPAIKAYLHTCQFLEDAGANDSHSIESPREAETEPDQLVRRGDQMHFSTKEVDAPAGKEKARRSSAHEDSDAPFAFTWRDGRITLGGTISSRKEALKALKVVEFMKDFLPEEPSETVGSKGDDSDKSEAKEDPKTSH